LIPAGSVRAAIEVVGALPLDPWAISPVVEDGPGGGMRLMPNVGEGEATTEPAFVSAVTAAAGCPKAALGDSSAENDQHTIPTITAHAPAVIPNHKTSPASLSRRSPVIKAASVCMIHPCAVVSGREHWRLNKG